MPGAARRDVIGHSFCLLCPAGPLLCPHLPFLGPAGVPAESPHRPLGLSDLSPESLAPFLLITTSPRTRIPEGSLAEVMTTPRTLGTAGPPFPGHSWLLRRVRAALATGPLTPRVSPPTQGFPGALGQSQRRRGHCPPQSERLLPSSGHPRNPPTGSMTLVGLRSPLPA